MERPDEVDSGTELTCPPMLLQLCPPTLQLGAYSAQFVVSRKRIREFLDVWAW